MSDAADVGTIYRRALDNYTLSAYFEFLIRDLILVIIIMTFFDNI